MQHQFRLEANNRMAGFDWAGAPRAPVREQVAEPQPERAVQRVGARVGLICRVAGNMVVGGVLLAGLMALPGTISMLLGRI